MKKRQNIFLELGIFNELHRLARIERRSAAKQAEYIITRRIEQEMNLPLCGVCGEPMDCDTCKEEPK